MPDPAKVKVAIVGCVLVIGASIGIGLGVSKKNSANGAIASNESSAIPGNTGVTYKDPSPTKAKDILDELEHGAARYGTYTGNYIDYNSNPLEENNRNGGDDDNEEIADWEDNGSWTDDGWDDDGWNDVSGCNLKCYFCILCSHLTMPAPLTFQTGRALCFGWLEQVFQIVRWLQQIFQAFFWWLSDLPWL
jgi:hypothetical protein